MASLFSQILNFGKRWQMLESETLELQKDIVMYETNFENDEFLFRLEPHINILLEKLHEQYDDVEYVLDKGEENLKYQELRLNLFRLETFKRALTFLENVYNERLV